MRANVIQSDRKMTMAKRSEGIAVLCLSGSLFALSLCGCGGSSSTATGTPPTPPPAVVSAGSYVFEASGTDGTDGDYFVVGSFVADANGKITSGTADYNLGSGVDKNVTLTGTYTVQGSVATVNLSSADNGFTDTFNTNLGSASAPVTNFDGTGSGMLYQQVTAGFSPAGTYNYTVKGEEDGTVTGSGSFVTNAGGTITSGSSTYTNDDATATATATGFVYAPLANGRGVGSVQGIDLAYYVISPTQILAIGLDDRALLMIPATKA